MFLIQAGANASGALIGLFLSLLLPTFVIMKYWKGVAIRHFDWALFCKCVKYGSPFIATYSLIFAIDASDRLLLKYFIGSAAVGLYAPAYDLAQQSLGVVMSVTHLAALPLAIQAYTRDGPNAAREQIQKNGLLFLAISLPATAGLVMLAEPITAQLMGPDFARQGAQIVRVIAIATFLSGVRSYYLDYPFYLVQNGKRQLIGILIAALVNISLGSTLIPIWGVMGAAYSTLIAFSVAALCSMRFGAAVFALPPPHKEVYKVLIATGILIVLLYMSDTWTGFGALVCRLMTAVIVYFGALLAMNFCQFRLGALFRNKL
jgi:O-antigen/teichoic acid export membrane protein